MVEDKKLKANNDCTNAHRHGAANPSPNVEGQTDRTNSRGARKESRPQCLDLPAVNKHLGVDSPHVIGGQPVFLHCAAREALGSI